MMRNTKQEDCLYVTMFGMFRIHNSKGISLDEHSIHSDMLTKLLAYMMSHSVNSRTAEELSEMLWENQESVNSIGALKNLIYRLRNLLCQQFGEEAYIITGSGTYAWNPEIKVILDIEVFEEFYEKAQEETNLAKKVRYLKEAVSQYTGKFMRKFEMETWVMPLSVYYHSMYLRIVKELLQMLEQQERYDEMNQYCHQALKVDEFDEDIHYYLIQSLIYENKYQMALGQYHQSCDLLSRNVGIAPSKKLRSAYENILKERHEIGANIQVVKKDLMDKQVESSGAFICDYGVFQKNYQLEIRRAKRAGNKVYLCLVTITPTLQYLPGSHSFVDTVKKGARQVEPVIIESLRSGDLVTRYSMAQYIVMLPVKKEEDMKMIVNRIRTKVDQLKQQTKVQVQYSLDTGEQS